MIPRTIARLSPALLLLVAASLPAAAHEKATVAIAKADCARLAAHVPAPDVAYQPGIDVHGRAVAPADLGGGSQLQIPETILIEIEVDLLERFGIPVNPALFDGAAEIGVVAYRGGRLYFNGQPLQDEAEIELAARCQKIVRE